jgi:hypothetical protein
MMYVEPVIRAAPYVDAIGKWNRYTHGERVAWCREVFSLLNPERQQVWIGVSVTYGGAVYKQIYYCYNQVNRPEITKQASLEV